MRKNKSFKLIIFLALFLLTCSLQTKVNAAISVSKDTTGESMYNELTNNGTINLSRSAVGINKYIFCRDKGRIFPSSGVYEYQKDPNANIVHYVCNEVNKGAGWAYLFGKNYNSLGSASSISGSALQQAVWYAINGDVTAYSRTLNTHSNGLITEAKAYENAINNNNGTFFNTGYFDSYTKFTYPTENGKKKIEDLYTSDTNCQRYTYGPFGITNCNSWIYNNELKAGLTEFYVSAINKKGKEISNPEFQILYDGEYNNSNTYNSKAYYKGKISYDNNKVDMTTFINSGHKKFYIRFKEQVTSFSFKVRYKYINATLDIVPIRPVQKTISYKTTYKCWNHENTDLSGYSWIAGARRKAVKSGTYTAESSSMASTTVNGYYRIYTRTGSKTTNHCDACGYSGVYKEKVTRYNGGVLETYYVCSRCGTRVSSRNFRSITVYYYNYTDYATFSCGDPDCGTTKTYTTTTDFQKLLVINPKFYFGTKEKTISFEPKATGKLVCKLDLQKYSYSDINNNNAKKLDGAKFHVMAIQESKEKNKETNKYEYKVLTNQVIPDEITDSTIVTIFAEPDNIKPVYVLITETKAPDGYEIMTKQMNLIFNYENGNFQPNFRPTQSQWVKEEGFTQESFGNWAWMEDEDANSWRPPNKYEAVDTRLYNDENEKIYADTFIYDSLTEEQQSGETIKTYHFKIYNRPEPPFVKIRLKKYNINSNITNGIKENLEKSTFRIKAVQNGKDIYDEVITVDNNSIGSSIVDANIEKEQTVTIKTDSIRRDKIYVTITEIDPPTGFTTINKPINLILNYNSRNNSYQPTFVPSEEQWNDNETFGGWVYDRENDPDGTTKFPNLYKSSAGDQIYIKQPGSSNNIPYEIEVYDEPEPIKLTLKKFGSYFNVEQNEIEGAKFTIKAYQKTANEISSISGVTIKTANQSGEGILENIGVDDEISILPKYISHKVYVTITETESPDNYRPLNKPISLLFKNDGHGIWRPKFLVTDSDIEDKSSFGRAFGENNYAFWSIVNTDDVDFSEDDNILKTYCLNPNSNYSTQLTIGDIRNDNNIKDIISIKPYYLNDNINNEDGEENNDIIVNDAGEGWTINVYNELPEDSIPINIRKYSKEKNDLENGDINDFMELPEGAEFKISAYQDGEWLFTDQPMENRFTENDDETGFYYNIETESKDRICVIITETKAPDGYKPITEPINILLYYEGKEWKRYYGSNAMVGFYASGLMDYCSEWQEYSSNNLSGYYRSSENDLIYVNSDDTVHVFDENQERFSFISLLKVDKNNRKLKDAKFSGVIKNVISFEGERTTGDGMGIVEFKADENGEFEFTWGLQNGELNIYNAILKDPTQDLVIELTEIESPDGFEGMPGTAIIRLSYDNRTATVVDNDAKEFVSVTTETDEEYNLYPYAQISILNEKIPTMEFTISKIDEDTNAVIDGAQFTGTISNIKSYKEEGTLKTANASNQCSVTWNLGKVTLTDVMVADPTKDVVITLHEDTAPEGYERINGDIIINVSYSEQDTDVTGPVITLVDENEDLDMTVQIDIINKPITPESEKINISGIVWTDGDTVINNKTNGTVNGIMDNGESVMSNIFVFLCNYNNVPVMATNTDSNGRYSFENIPFDEHGYVVWFEYNGVRYKDTVYKARINDGQINSSAKEDEYTRNYFNNLFNKIEYNTARNSSNNSSLPLKYLANTSNGVQTSRFYVDSEGRELNGYTYNGIDSRYAMYSSSEAISTSTDDLNFGLVIRGTDMALTTNECSAQILINGKAQNEEYDLNGNAISLSDIGKPKVAYNLAIRKSDYNYRIRDYVNNEGDFTDSNYTDNTSSGYRSGNELTVYVKYRVDLINQGPVATKINSVKYYYDGSYTYDDERTKAANETGLIQNNSVSNNTSNSTLVVNFSNGIDVPANSTKTFYLVFELPNNKIVDGKTYINVAEIASYSTSEGVIDIDSNPGNLSSRTATPEDDSCSSKGLKLSLEDDYRTISGYVWDDKNGNSLQDDGDANKVDGVVVQLIELKSFDGETYKEYIWQETVSGTNTGKRMRLDGTGIVDYTYDATAEKGRYEFNEFIPGNYIVRFIYGDGTTVDGDIYGSDMYKNVLKYNGQDYKSTVNSNYNLNEFDASKYPDNASVASDNEARRLETMAYSVDMTQEKGLLLKLLEVNGLEELNATEIKTFASMIGETVSDPTDLTSDEEVRLMRGIIEKQKEVLQDTWMCAETPRVNVAVGFGNLDVMNFGLKERPKPSMELKKYITGIKVVAGDGKTTLVSADIPINSYMAQGGPIIQGINDGLMIIENTKLQFEVGTPTELNTILEGATLEFTYTLRAKNVTKEIDYLGSGLVTAYSTAVENNDMTQYEETLKTNANVVKRDISRITRQNNVGSVLGTTYYIGGNSDAQNQIEISQVFDYVNKDLKFVSGTNGVVENGTEERYILNDDNSLSLDNVTVLKTEHTGILGNNGFKDLYSVLLSPTFKISAGGVKEFDNYIAEIMAYTVANGRRAFYTSKADDTGASTSMTPGNAEIVNHEFRPGREHEPDEADTLKIVFGVETGENKNIILMWSIISGICLIIIGIGTFVTKKYILKK